MKLVGGTGRVAWNFHLPAHLIPAEKLDFHL